jgi:phage tail protein X
MMSGFRLKVFGLPALALLLFCGGCGGDTGPMAPEVDEPLYRQALQRKREGNTQEALADYLRVIVKRSDQAPESHLEAGLIYLLYSQDPIAAIYHFNKYLELEPNSPRAADIHGLIDTAKRNFAKTLPLATPAMEGAAGHTDLLDQVNHLQRENDELKAQLVSARGEVGPFLGGHTAADADSAPAPVAVTAPPEETARISPVAEAPPPPSPAPAPVTVAAPRSRPAAAPAKTGAGRAYTVQAHDTLYAIAKKVYGTATKARVEAIREANRGVITAAGGLKPGMQLRMP